MYCPNCNKEISNDDKFCAFCGTPVRQSVQGESNQPQSDSMAQNNPNNQPQMNPMEQNNQSNQPQMNQMPPSNPNNQYGYSQQYQQNNGDQSQQYQQNKVYQTPFGSFQPNIPTKNTGLNILSFFLPFVGLILYLVKKDEAPLMAKSIGKSALAGFITEVVLVIIIYIIYFVITAAILSSW